jgi:hypothetical protein
MYWIKSLAPRGLVWLRGDLNQQCNPLICCCFFGKSLRNKTESY